MEPSQSRTPQHHNLRQPLNVISLTIANFRLRIEPKLDEVDAAYLNRKLERIEGELNRLAKMLDELAPVRVVADLGKLDPTPSWTS